MLESVSLFALQLFLYWCTFRGCLFLLDSLFKACFLKACLLKGFRLQGLLL